MSTNTTWVCPHLDPEALEMIQRSLAFSIKYANRNPQTRAELEALHDLLAATREHLRASGAPWIIENVVGAPMRDAVLLCGEMFELRVLRHRLFESNSLLLAPSHPKHRPGGLLDGSYIAVYGGKWLVGGQAGIKGRIPLEFRAVAAQRAAMGIDWMTGAELVEAIPPAYSAYLAPQIASAALEPAS